ncbi:unnamed protein product [Closterium sp. NIES-54]
MLVEVLVIDVIEVVEVEVAEVVEIEAIEAEPGGAEPGVLRLGVLSLRVLRLGVLSLGVRSLGVLSLRVLLCLEVLLVLRRDCLRTHLRSGATGARGAGAAGAGGAGVTAATGPGGARTRGAVAAGTGGVGGTGAGDSVAGGTRTGGAGVGGTGAGGAGASGTAAGDAGDAGVGGTSVGGAGAGGAGAVDPGDTVRPRPYFVPLLQQRLSLSLPVIHAMAEFNLATLTHEQLDRLVRQLEDSQLEIVTLTAERDSARQQSSVNTPANAPAQSEEPVIISSDTPSQHNSVGPRSGTANDGAAQSMPGMERNRAAPSTSKTHEACRHVEFAATIGNNDIFAPMPLKPQRPPCFDPSQRGGPTVQSWVFTMNVFFDVNYIESDAAKIRYAVSLLRGPAMYWWQVIVTSPCAYELLSQEEEPMGPAVIWSSFCKTIQYSTWDAWCAGLRACFELIAASISAHQRLRTWRQLGSVQDYTSGFLALCEQVGYMHEAERVDRYVGGLKPNISHEIMLRGLSNFSEIPALAEKISILRHPRPGVSLYDLASGAATAPPATADSATRSQWLTRDAATRLAIRNHLPLAECAHFGQHRTAQALYDAVVARYSSPATAALGRLLLPYLFPELSAFATVKDLVSHLRASDARYRAAAPAEFLDKNQPPIFITLYFIVTRLPDSLRSVKDHFLSLDPTSLTVDLLKHHLLAAETSAVAVGAARGTPRPPFFEGCSLSPLAPFGGGDGGSNGSGGSGGGGTGGGGTGARCVGSGGGQRQQQQSPQQHREWFLHGESGGSCPYVILTGVRAGQTCGKLHTQHRCFSCLDDAWRAEFGDDVELPRWADLLRSRIGIFDLDFDAILSAMYALSVSGEGDCYRCVPPAPGIAATALGASESGTLPGPAPAQALHTFMLDSGASRCFFRDSTTLTPLPAPVPVRLADPSGGPVVARSSTALPYPLLLQGPTPSGASLKDPPPGTTPVEVAVGSGAAPDVESGGAASGGAELGGAGSEGAGSGGAEPGGEEPGAAEPEGVELGGADSKGAESRGAELGGAESEGAESEGAEPRGATSSGVPAGASLCRSPQQLHEWLVWRARLRSGAPGAGGARDAGAGDAGVTAGASGSGGTAAAGPGGARTRGAGAAGTGGVVGAGVGDPTEPGAGVGDTGAGGAGVAGAGAVDPGAGGAGGTLRTRSYFVPLLQQVLGVSSSTALTPPLLCPPPDQSQPPLQPASPLPAPSPYTEPSSGLTEQREPASRPVSPASTARCVPRSRPPPVPGTPAMALRPSSVPLHVPLLAPSESSLPEVPDPESDRARAASPTFSRLLATAVTDPSFESADASALVAELLDFAAAYRLDYATALVAESESASPPSVGGECALGLDVLEDTQEDFECIVVALPRSASMQLAPEADPDAPDIPTPRSYAEAITVDGMWIFRVMQPSGSPRAFKARYVARGFSQRQGVDYFQTFSPTPKMTTLQVLLHIAAQCDYELHSLDFSTAFLQGSLHEEI